MLLKPGVRDERWLVRIPAASRPPLQLVCFPYAGAGAAAFYPWARLAGGRAGILAVRFPGRESRFRESPIEYLSEAVQPIADAISEAVHGPYALFGHSLGGLAAYEVARELVRRPGRKPSRLFVSATPAPQLPWPHPPLHALPEDELLAALAERYRPIPDALLRDTEYRGITLRMLRADFHLAEAYRHIPGDPLPCPITAFGGTEDSSVGTSLLTGWKQMTTGPCRMVWVPGDHFFIETAAQQVLNEVLYDTDCRLSAKP